MDLLPSLTIRFVSGLHINLYYSLSQPFLFSVLFPCCLAVVFLSFAFSEAALLSFSLIRLDIQTVLTFSFQSAADQSFRSVCIYNAADFNSVLFIGKYVYTFVYINFHLLEQARFAADTLMDFMEYGFYFLN